MPGPASWTATVNEPWVEEPLSNTSPLSVNLIALPARLSRLREPLFVAASLRQLRHDVDLERDLLLGRQWLDRTEHRLDDILERIVSNRERELAGFDLGQVEHVVDQAQKVPTVALHPVEHAA